MDVNMITGPVVLAVVVNAILYGICIVQWFNYFTAGLKDSWHTKLLVLWVICIDTFQMAATMYMLWEFTVTNFGNKAILTNLPWPYLTTPIFVVSVTVPIQLFLGYRIKVLSQTWLWFAIIAVISLAQGACGMTGAIIATRISNPTDFTNLIPIADVWIGLFVFTDILITVLLFIFLRKSKTGFQRMDSIIETLIRMAVQTASIATTLCVIALIAFNVWPNTCLTYVFELVQSRAYTNTLMVTLNSRTRFRERLKNNEVQQLGPESILDTLRFSPAEVGVVVQQDVQADIPDLGSTNKSEKKHFYDV